MTTAYQQQQARKFVAEAILKLTLAVGRSGRLGVPADRVILTCDPARASPNPGQSSLITMSPLSLQLALEEMKKHRVPLEGPALIIQQKMLDRPWFDIRVEEQECQLILCVATVHPIAA